MATSATITAVQQRVRLEFDADAKEQFGRIRRPKQDVLKGLLQQAAFLYGVGRLMGEAGNDGFIHIPCDVKTLNGLINLALKKGNGGGGDHNGGNGHSGHQQLAETRQLPDHHFDEEKARRAIEGARTRLELTKRYNPGLNTKEAESLLAIALNGLAKIAVGDETAPAVDSIMFTAKEAAQAAEKAVLESLANEIRRLALAGNSELSVESRIESAMSLPFNDARCELYNLRSNLRTLYNIREEESEGSRSREDRGNRRNSNNNGGRDNGYHKMPFRHPSRHGH